ncbi:P-loop containing nucleoside triphosphate hydrolase protein [Saccharata proteae CBS 121410]|uniref:P-loop containing nucleoside triphosphate hydrolase protein n=1 Tax=Saccharata proteae CBS 121410 TaxID=1314787 RepID=A0A9P4I2C7_9PEZI|nr:P-loop containing nucleoside triphosphate hydrolase protein [Saccharata proteae CBS 121410]
MAAIVDDKSPHCIPFILDRLAVHRATSAAPFFLGLNGVQGAGKTTLVSTLCHTLRSSPYNLPTVVLSIDDLYLTHADQALLAKSHPENALIQHRGEPGTHDLSLGRSVFRSLLHRQPTKIPVYDKAAFDGQGDRAEEQHWPQVNQAGEAPVEVVIFEGWCVGFRPLSNADICRKWQEAKQLEKSGKYTGRLARHQLEHLIYINDKLRAYDALTNMLVAFIHIDAEETHYVYDWRLEQEAALKNLKGSGMSAEQVIKFVDGYYPAYELYTATLRAGIFGADKNRQLRLVVGKDRKVKQVTLI